jgi:hypothetical protein
MGTLIGRIGSGPWFVIGTSTSFKAKTSGTLTLLFNDRANYYVDNAGTATAQISVRRPVAVSAAGLRMADAAARGGVMAA